MTIAIILGITLVIFVSFNRVNLQSLAKAIALIIVGFIMATVSSTAIANLPPILHSNNHLEQSDRPSCATATRLPWLQVDGKWVKDEAGNPVTLRGISFCGFNNSWGEKALPDFPEKISQVTNGINGWYPNLLLLPIKDYHLNDSPRYKTE